MSNFILKTLETRELKLNTIRLRGFYGGKLRKGSGGGGSGDGFPQLPGDVTRWHFGGLTNEMMAAMDDPRIEDADHKGRFLSFKNFAWGGMSGVGGYIQNFNKFTGNAPVDKVRIDEQNSNSIKVTILTTGINNAIYIPKNIYQFNKSYFIKISSEGYNEGDMSLSFYAPSTSTATTVTVSLNPNGINEIPAIKEDDYLAVYISVGGKVGSITIEQLPLYPGFILGDGVDDFAVTEEDFNFEKEFCVYLVAIFFPQDSPHNDAVLGKDSNKDIRVLQYNNNLTFNSGNHTYCPVSLGQFSIVAFKRKDDTLLAKNLTTGVSNSVKATSGVLENPDKFYLWIIKSFSGYSNAAIAGQIIDNGHFTTDEEDENILNWHKKQYPWLFPDQAWTVTGKTNEDEDRATIANITGNGNDLVLSNFGFAEGSGYGLYKTPFELYPSVQHSSKYSLSFSKFALGDHNLIIAPKQNDLSYDIKVKVTGLKEGVKFKWGWIGTTGYIDITTDGIHMLNKPASQIRQLIVEFAEDFDPDHVVTIEQIPEYEGYLLTDGVDDKVVSAESIAFTDAWTIITDTVFLGKVSVASGIIASNIFTVYNYQGSGTIAVTMGDGGSSLRVITSSIKAFSSDGTVYDAEWNEYHVEIGIIRALERLLKIGTSSNETSYFCQLAFKFLGIYNNQLLSKDDCIKAYNYLQSLKAK